eukprot:GHVL01034629.1.p1 GENE.GHVL01034629.1~~GHVL01034629.1.p1  ORF type:complete len:880 (-),score=174.00 GHVL01034629.1:608-2962(-)
MEWVPMDELLVCVFSDGTVRVFTPQGTVHSSFTIRKDRGLVICASIWKGGLVCITENYQIFVNIGHFQEKSRKLPETGMKSPPTGICVYGDLTIIVGLESGNLLVFNNNSFTEMKIGCGPFNHFAVSWSERLLACLSTSGDLYVLNSHNLKPVDDEECDFKGGIDWINNQKYAKSIKWVADDCVAIYTSTRLADDGVAIHSSAEESNLFIGGPRNRWLNYKYPQGPLILRTEVDGVRVITPNEHQMISRVSPSTEAIYSIGSYEPPAMLCWVLERFEAADVGAVESLMGMRPKLKEAADMCVDGAVRESSLSNITALLKSASLGLSMVQPPPQDRNELIAASRDCRICLTLSSIEFPVTVSQLRNAGISSILKRIGARRREHFVALQIAKYVGIPTNQVLLDWSIDKILTSMNLPDEEVAAIIVEHLTSSKVRYTDIAQVAAKMNRRALAILLVQYETNCHDQVLMFLDLEEYHGALEKAIEAHDPDLVLECIRRICNKIVNQANDSEVIKFVNIIKSHKTAVDIFTVYCKKNKLKNLLLRFYSNYLPKNTPCLSLELGYTSNNFDEKMKHLRSCSQLLHAGDRESQMEAAILDEQIELLQEQHKMDSVGAKKGWKPMGDTSTFVGLSMMQTIRELILRGETAQADRLQRGWKIQDKRYWRCKINGLADGGQWTEFNAFALHRASPVGFGPFLEACHRHFYRNQDRTAIINETVKNSAKDILFKNKSDVPLVTTWASKFGFTPEMFGVDHTTDTQNNTFRTITGFMGSLVRGSNNQTNEGGIFG